MLIFASIVKYCSVHLSLQEIIGSQKPKCSYKNTERAYLLVGRAWRKLFGFY